MELNFKSRTLQRACSEKRESDRLWGAECARIVRRRLVQLAAAETLAVIRTLHAAKLRALSGSRDGQYAVDALPPACVILEPWHDPVPTLPDGRLDTAKITAVRILAVEHSH
jgi:proteic killer suppression protein